MSQENILGKINQEPVNQLIEQVSSEEMERIKAVSVFYELLKNTLLTADVSDENTKKELEKLSHLVDIKPEHIMPRGGRSKATVYPIRPVTGNDSKNTNLIRQPHMGIFVTAYSRSDRGGHGFTVNSDIRDTAESNHVEIGTHAKLNQTSSIHSLKGFTIFMPYTKNSFSAHDPFDRFRSPIIRSKLLTAHHIKLFEDPVKIEDFYTNVNASLQNLQSVKQK